ncbi:MAG: PAS domain S-box protein [Bacteroidales bacterium]
MPGLKIKVCFWYLDPALLEEILGILAGGKFDVDARILKDNLTLRDCLKSDPPDLLISDYDLPQKLRSLAEEEMEPYSTSIPFLYVVGEKNERTASSSLQAGIWDFVSKDRLFKLVPSVYSALKYGKVISRFHEAERELRSSRDRYMSIFNTVSEGIAVLDMESREVLEHNPRFLEIYNLTSEDLVGVDIERFSSVEDGFTLERARAHIREAIEGNQSVFFEWLNKVPDGRLFYTYNSVTPIRIGDRDCLLLITRDIHKSKQLEKTLSEAQEHFRALADNSPDIILRFDRQKRHLFVNQAVERYTGRSVKEMIGRTNEELKLMPEVQIRDTNDALDRVFATGQPTTMMSEAGEGEHVTILDWRLYPEIGQSGSVESVMAISRDVTRSLKAQEALAASEERLNLAMSGTGLGMWDWTVDSNEVYYSPTWFSMLGYTPDELPQEFGTWTALLHQEDRDRVLATIDECVRRKEKSFEIEFRLRHKKGHFTWILSKGRVVGRDERGETQRMTGIHININDRKRNELVRQVLVEISNATSSTRNLEELYGIIRLNLGRVLDTTNCFLALYNEESDTLTLPFMEDEKEVITEFPARKTLTSFVIGTGKAQLVDPEREKQLHDDGLVDPVGPPCVSWLGVPLKHQDKIIGVFAVQSYSQDIVFTPSDAVLLEFASDQIALAIERRRHLDKLRENQEWQRRVFESSPDPLLVLNQRAEITDFNSAFLEAFQTTPELSRGKRIFHFLQPEYWRRSIRDFQITWEKGYLKNLEYEAIRPDGRVFPAEVSSGAMYNVHGEPESMVLIVKNIAERKEAERKLLEAKVKAEESDKLKTAFLSNMSHEIRTPMNAIVGFSDLLTDDRLSAEERKDFIAQINQGADDLMRLIDDIIDIAKIEAGQVNIHIAETFIGELFRELHMMFQQNIRRVGKDMVNLKLQWDWPMDDLVLYTDGFRLRQILINLLGNAIKFTEAGDVVLGIESHPKGVLFYVKDSGIGIRKEKLQVIFDRFMQGHEGKTKLYGGTGLGLAISKNLTELLGGVIDVDSRPGKGSTFWLILPLKEVPIKHEAAIKVATSESRSWNGKKLLIAEDDHSNYYFLYEALKETGLEIIWARNGEETLELFSEHEDLDVVLMDIQMPFKNGYECTREIKKKRSDLPVIAQTAYAMSGEKQISQEAGCDDYLSKPIKVTDLLNTLSRFL